MSERFLFDDDGNLLVNIAKTLAGEHDFIKVRLVGPDSQSTTGYRVFTPTDLNDINENINATAHYGTTMLTGLLPYNRFQIYLEITGVVGRTCGFSFTANPIPSKNDIWLMPNAAFAVSLSPGRYIAHPQNQTISLNVTSQGTPSGNGTANPNWIIENLAIVYPDARSQGSGLTLSLTTSGGAISSASVSAGGTGYGTGDLLKVVQGGGSGGVVRVVTQASGIVSAVDFNTGAGGLAGTGYSNGAATTAQNDESCVANVWVVAKV